MAKRAYLAVATVLAVTVLAATGVQAAEVSNGLEAKGAPAKKPDGKLVQGGVSTGKASMTEERAAAIETWKKMAGDEGLDTFIAAADSDALLAPIPKLVLDFGLGDIWSRPGLEMKEKSTVTIALLIATHQYPELKAHMKFALRNGLTIEKIRDILVHCILYTGFPPVVEAQKQLLDVIKELGLDDKYPHPRPWPGVRE